MANELQIPMTSANGVLLKTSGTYCSNDIQVAPQLETLTVTANGEYTPSKVGYNKVTVNVATGGTGGNIDGLINGSITSITSNVRGIGAYKFYFCEDLTYANFPYVTSVGVEVFLNNTSLVTANFPQLKEASHNLFKQCSALQNVDLSSATKINKYAFASCGSLTRLDLPKAQLIYTYAFTACSSLGTLILRNTETFRISGSDRVVCYLDGTNHFYSTPIASGTGYIYVPSALVDSYKADTKWSAYANQIRAIEDYPEITGG